MGVVTREQCVEQSVQDYVRDGLATHGYGAVVMRDAFPSPDERAKELTVTTVAVGFNFDDGGTHVELGSDLTLRMYTIEFWTFGLTPTWGRNVAHVIRAILELGDYNIPLKDLSQIAAPVMDQLIIPDDHGIVVQRQIAHDPREWDRNVWTTTLKVEDYYLPTQSLLSA